MAGNYQTAEEWMKQKYGSSGSVGSQSQRKYQTADEWMQQYEQRKASDVAGQRAQLWSDRYKKLQDNLSGGSYSLDDAVDEVNSLLRGYSGNTGIRGYLDVQNVQDYDSAYRNLLDIRNSKEFQSAVRRKQYKSKYDGKSYSEIEDILSGLGDGEERDWLNANRFDIYKTSSDFGYLSKAGLDSFAADQAARNSSKEKKQSFGEIMVKALAGAGNPGTNAMTEASFQLATDKSYQQPREDWTADQRNVYGYLYAQNKEKAAEYAQSVNDAYNAAAQEEEAKKTAEFAKKHKVISTVGSVAGNASGLGMADLTATMLEKIARGTVTQKDYLSPHQYTETATGAISQDLNEKYGTLNEKIPVIGGRGWGDAYQIANSFATSMATAHTVGMATDIIFFGNAAASTIYEAKDRGATDDQAISLGLVAGAAEAMGEHFSVSHLLGLENSDIIKPFLKNILSQTLVEGEEESFTTFINNLADYWIMGDKSEFKTLVAEYLTENPDAEDKDAVKYALTKMGNDMAFDFIGGAISGAAGGAVGTAVNDYYGSRYYHDTYGSSQRELVQKALDIDPERKVVQKASQRLDSGKDLSGRQIWQIVESNDRTVMEQAVKQRLTEMGETGDTDAISRAITKQARSEELTFQEKQALRSSSIGDVVAREVESGEIWDRVDKEPADDAGNETAAVDKTGEKAVPVDKEAMAPERRNTILPTVEESPAVENNATTEPVTLESLSQKYGDQAKAMQANYMEGQDVEEYDRAFQMVYGMGKAGVNVEYALKSEATSFLSESQREIAYQIGVDAANASAKAQAGKNAAAANGKTGWRKGTVRGENVKIADLVQTFNDPQRNAYKALCTIAEATGIDIVLYKSQANDSGEFEGEQGRFKWKDNTIYIDVNAGLSYAKDAQSVSKYAMLRTFGHEFTHFIEKWNPEQYNEFRKVVFQTMENPTELIETKLSQDSTGKMTYDDASREVVADGMTDILEDSQFLQELAKNHRSVFEILKEKLKEFVDNLKSYFQTLSKNGSREAAQLKKEVGDNISYLDDIVKQFDAIAVQAVENYQKTVAEDEQESTSSESEQHEVTETDSSKEYSEQLESKSEENDSIAQETAENPQKPDSETASASETKYDGFTISQNEERGTLEITFDSKPSQEVRDALKKRGFRWSSKNKLWYGKGNSGKISEIINSAMNEPSTDAPIVNPVEAVQKPTAEAENNLPQDTPAENNSEEVTNNAETDVQGQSGSDETIREDHTGGLRESEQPGEGTPRLLDELEAGDVQQHEPAAASGDSGVGGRQAGRDGVRSDSERNERGRGTGSGQSGDLRDGNVDSSQNTFRQSVEKQIAQKSTEKPKGTNYTIGESLNLASGEKARFSDNVSALKLIKQLETEGRYATQEEQEVLAKYVGWGGLDKAFGEMTYNRETRKREMTPKSGWEKEFRELRKLVEDGVLTEEEYRGMSESTKNAHYTSMEVIRAMYDGLKQLGFQGGRMMEPSCGVGNFVGGMPSDMTATVKSWTMVELDRVTGQIAKYLYPNNDVRIEGFQDANIPDGFMDVAIGNVPFGNYGVVDRAYPNRMTKSIHNYFFAKSLDKVRNGGIVMFITSSFTMNSENNAARQYIMSKADLLGAIRLPNNAFSGNAGTEVVTDILILRKRADGLPYSGQQFLEAKEKKIPGSWRNYYVNEYFESHPEMVLGTEAVTRGMYGAETVTYNPAENAGSLGDQIRKAFGNIQEKMFYPEKTAEQSRKAAEIASRKPKNGSYRKLADGTIQNSSGNTVTDQDVSRRISGIIDIRDAYRNLVERIQQGRTQKEIAAARANLNSVYDSFVKENGYINDPKNKKAFAEDPDRFCVFSLETDYQKAEKGKKASARKADIFTKDTIRANVTVTHADSVRDGLIVSINTTGSVDTALIAKLTGKEESSVSRELIDSRMAFKTKDGTLQAPETYLSGNVRAKLREAEALSRLDPDFQNNVEELKRVIPKDIPYDEIYVSPGAVWVPTEVYADFIAEMLGGRNNGYGGPDVQVAYSSQTGEFKIRLNNGRLKSNYRNTQELGTSRRSFLDLMEALMGNGNVTVTDKTLDENGNERRVVNKDETAAAQEKADKIKAKFQEWIWSDETRRNELSRLYNETYNALATPKYDGSDLTVNGLNAMYSLRPHQANAVKRIIASGGNTLLAHRVGAGKTLEMAAAAMKLRELGIVKKPVFVVPKSLVAQWGVEFHNYFPAAKLLVADDKSFEKSNRKVFTNNIANGDFDAVILSYEQFGKVPMSNAFQEQFLQEQIDDVLNAIAEEKAENGKGSLTVKQMEKKVAQLKTKLEKLKIQAVDADNVDFESLGIDALFVDEAHNFKNLQYTTRMQNVGGLGNADGSQRAFDLYTKIRYLQKLNGGRGIVFATATPVMNSMAEMYIMQKYLQSDMLQQLGITTFDAWAKQFGEVTNTYEIKPSGQGVRAKQVFSNFKNLNELQLMFRSFSDVLTEVPGLKIPKMRGGNVQIVECAPGKFQQDFMKQLEKRANSVKNVDPSVDNMLKITSDGRKVSYTQRMIDPSLPYEPGCKLYRCCENILNEYRQSTGMTVETGGNQTTINGTQIVFCDMATPKGTDKSKANADTVSTDDTMDLQSARLYEDMRDYLSKNGIPKSQIAFIHEADTDGKRKQLFADMNSGKVRVLIGSTGKMGVGMNAQRCVTAIHHLDAPWRPGDVEQRDGRAFRQGNLNGEVSKYVYVTKGSFDARLWDILDRKSGFINQIMNGDDVGRNAEDTGDVTLSAAEVKALASGNPMIKESVELADELQKLNGLKRTRDSAVTRARTKLLQDTQEIAYLKSAIAARKADIGKRTDTFREETFSMLVGNKAFTDRKSAGEALLSAILSKCKTDNSFEKIGSFAGFDILAAKSDGEFSGVLQGEMRYGFKVHINNSTLMVGQMAKTIAGLESELSKTEERLLEVTKDKAAQETLVAQPFERQQELDEKRKRYDFVMAELSKTEQQIASDDDRVQYQLRPVPPVIPTNGGWERTKNTEEAMEIFPNMWNVAAEESETRNPTQIASTVGTYRKIFNILRSENFQGKILDASSGMGIGTSVGRNEYGFDIEDIEPFPGNGYIPMYTDYSQLGNKYDVIISSAVLNVLPQDQRDALVVKMGEMLNDNGRMFITTRGNDVETLAKTGKNIHLGKMEWIETVKGSYQKGFTNPELISYLKDALGDGFIVEPASKSTGGRFNNNTNVVVTKKPEFVQNQGRTNTLTDRDILSMAADSISVGNLTAAEADALQIFQKRLDTLESLQNERAELGRTYKEQQFGENVDRKAAAQTLQKMRQMDSRIQEADQKVISAETAPALRKVLPRARKIVEQKQKEKDDATLKRWRDRRNNAAAIKKYRDQITKNVKDISDWILNPSNKNDLKHVPDALKSTVIPFLTSIDFTSKRQLSGGAATKADQRFMERLKAMEKTMKEMTGSSDLYSGYVDLPPDFMDNLSSFVSTAQEIVNQNNGQFVINQMTSQELKELSSIVTVLKKHIQDLNRFHANSVYQHVYDAGDATIAELKGYNDAKSRSKAGETVNDFIFWQQIRPAYAFERFGSGGKAIYDELRRGQSKLAFNTKEIVEFSKNAYTDEEVKAWEKEVKEVKIGGETVKMKVSQIMSFYELLKREQARGHIFGQGIRVSSFRADGKAKISDVGHRITIDEANRIIDVLTPRQIEVADKLQKYMQEKGGEWGNYVTVKRFGEKIFGEENYFPINSDGRNLETTMDNKPENASLYALLNMGFTKKLQKEANNRVVVYSIFDVFSNHMASMAQYNALALPVVDALKWFNYQQKEDMTVTRDDGTEKVIHQVTDSVKSQLDRVYGVPEEKIPGKRTPGYAESFITGILKAFNGTETQGISSDSIGLNFLHRYNMAQVAYNLRVVIQQPLAITRAAMIIDYGSIIRGLKMSPSEIRKNIQEMQTHSGIAAWKDLGFYDTNISRGLSDIIKHSETKMDKVREFGMIGAEKADQITWAAMWNSCKEEVQRKYGLKAGSDGFYEAVTSLFEEVIYKTQVVDSVLTKNAFLRSKGFFPRATGSFMSEPTTTASMLVDAFDKYRMDLQKPGATKRSAWEKNRHNIGRTAYVYCIGAVILAAVQAVADAFRDDDDYEKYGEKWQEAFIGNVIDELMPFNKLPVMADFYEGAKELLSRIGFDTYGNVPNSYWMQWVDSLAKGTEIIYKNITKDEKNRYTWFGGIFKYLQTISGLTGFPMAAATREIVSSWNTIVGAMAPSLKIKSYDPGEKASIQYAYQDGYLTEEEAISELLSNGLAESQEDAYWTVQEWGAGVGYSRYDAINQAIRNGDDITNEMEQLTSHGYSRKDVLPQIKKNIGEWFRGGEISEEQARDMLKQYAEMKDDDISDAISRWRSYLDAGISYEEIKEKYLNGTLDARTAADMYVKYGGYSQDDAEQKIRAFDFENQYGISWDNRKEAYMDGKISAAELRKALMYVDGKTAEEADTYLAGIDFEIQHGFAYSDRQSAYINGTVSRSDMKRILIEERGYDEEDAELTIDAFDWIRDHPESDYDTNTVMSYLRPLDGLGYSAEGCGIPIDTFVKERGYINTIESDKDEDGNGIAYSRINKAFPYIDSLPLTAEQKTALAVACGWSVKTVDKKKPW